MNAVLDRLPILILSPHSRCNCRCVMCDIWKVTDAREITAADLERHAADIEKLKVEWVVFTGGEPLMHSDLFRLCRILRERGVRITILSTGLLIARHAAQIIGNVDDVIVSLDGPAAVHDRIRRTPGAYKLLKAGVEAIHRLQPAFPIAARCTVQRANCQHLRATAAGARSLGLKSISFLAADLTSPAFNRPEMWDIDRQFSVGLTSDSLAALGAEIESLILETEGALDGFVVESPQKLRRIVAHFRAHLYRTEPVAPVCNAPWVSAVVESDGTVRPCFFHPPVARIENGMGLREAVNSPKAVAFRERLNVASNPTCRRCVCSLNWRGPGSVGDGV